MFVKRGEGNVMDATWNEKVTVAQQCESKPNNDFHLVHSDHSPVMAALNYMWHVLFDSFR